MIVLEIFRLAYTHSIYRLTKYIDEKFVFHNIQYSGRSRTISGCGSMAVAAIDGLLVART